MDHDYPFTYSNGEDDETDPSTAARARSVLDSSILNSNNNYNRNNVGGRSRQQQQQQQQQPSMRGWDNVKSWWRSV